MHGPTRRAVITAMVATTLAAPLKAYAATPETIDIWPGRAPGAPGKMPVRKIEQRSDDPTFNDRWITGVDRPTLSVRRPANPNGAAVMLIPGGGYGFLSWDNEGEEQARWLNGRGVTCFILTYRLPGEGWANRASVPLSDAQRAMRLIRANAAAFGVDASRVSVMGFSAGGHLAGSLATRHAEPSYTPVDAADRLSARPDLVALIYPVISMVAPFTHVRSRDALLGAGSIEAQQRIASIEHGVSADTPPAFLVHASDDGLVPITNSLALYQAMLAAQRPVELHAFDQGGHGFGVRLPKTVPASAWPELLIAYMRRTGMMEV